MPWLYRNLDTALLRERPLGGCVKEDQQLGCMGRAKQVWTCPPTKDTEEQAGQRQSEPKVCSEDGSQELCMNSVPGTGSGAAYTEGSGRLSTPKS